MTRMVWPRAKVALVCPAVPNPARFSFEFLRAPKIGRPRVDELTTAASLEGDPPRAFASFGTETPGRPPRQARPPAPQPRQRSTADSGTLLA